MLQSQELNQLYTRFREQAERSGAQVRLVDNLGEATRFIATVMDNLPGYIVLPVVLTDLPEFKTALGGKLRQVTNTASVTDAAAGVSFGEFGIAETGSVAYAVNDPLERQLTMLSAVYFGLVYADRLVADLETAGEQVKKLQLEEGRRYISFVTGPSRTADIERVLTIGVQGPKELYVIVIES